MFVCQVSHLEFWQRYLFRKALLEDEEARRVATERRAQKERQAAENFQWDQGKQLIYFSCLNHEFPHARSILFTVVSCATFFTK
jgi:preprotein translocase subunit SecB